MAGEALRAADLPGRGRALLAAREILEGEVILSESPMLLYPSSLASLRSYCSACFRSLPPPPHAPAACPSCRAAAFCSPACAAASHPRLLCAALSRNLAAAPDAHQEALLFLLSAYSLPDPSLRALLSLSSAPSPSQQQQDTSTLHAMVSSLAPPHLLPPGFSPDLTAALLSKDRTNSFSIMEPYRPDVPLELRKTRAYAVYLRASLLNHDCLPNACHFDYADRPGPGNTDIVVRALHGISEGREVCISYFAANWRYADRQRRLLEDYGFRCECDRCQVESKWKFDDDDGGDGDDTMEEEHDKEDAGDGVDEGMEQEEGSDGGDDDFPHSFFFVRYLCDREDCYGMLAPLPPLPNGDLSHVFECNACGQLKKEEEDDDEPDAGESSMVN